MKSHRRIPACAIFAWLLTTACQDASAAQGGDTVTTIKVNVGEVLLRVVVRDSKGRTVGNLQAGDFQLWDDGTHQAIEYFELQQVPPTTPITQLGSMSEGKAEANPVPLQQRFTVYLFDDVHLNFLDLSSAKLAALRHCTSMSPMERAAIFLHQVMSCLSLLAIRTCCVQTSQS